MMLHIEYAQNKITLHLFADILAKKELEVDSKLDIVLYSISYLTASQIARSGDESVFYTITESDIYLDDQKQG